MTEEKRAPEVGAKGPTDGAAPADAGIPARLREAWHKTVGTFATDDKGTQGLLDRLVSFKQLSAEEARRVMQEARARIEQNRKELDRRVDDSVKKVTDRFADPEVKVLEERIAFLEGRIKELEAEAPAS